MYDQKYASNQAKKQGVTRKAMLNALLSNEWTQQESNPKYRYVQVLDKSDTALVDRIERMRQPYPKRDRE